MLCLWNSKTTEKPCGQCCIPVVAGICGFCARTAQGSMDKVAAALIQPVEPSGDFHDEQTWHEPSHLVHLRRTSHSLDYTPVSPMFVSS